MADFQKAMDELLEFEGGYVDDPKDSGGETKYGISKKAYPNVNIKTLTLDGAKGIYFRDYWQPCGAEWIDDQELAEEVFKAAVNCGVATAVKRLQASVNDLCGRDELKADGKVGSKTLDAVGLLVNLGHGKLLRCTFELEMIKHYASLKGFKDYGRGWCNRVLSA